MRYLRSFWYDFIVGDSWETAVGVVAALGATWFIIEHHASLSEALGPLFAAAIIVIMVISLIRK
ncbi:MAG: hypothetical protein EXR50_06995 [Dehalococcoidia bacterium]|nr:hypothetical protein [Dehalococcoidia bacterium]